MSVLDIATRYVELGFSVIPVRCDGTKAPLLPGWREFSERRPTGEELLHWFGNGTVAGIGIPCGPASGHMAVLDFETAKYGTSGAGMSPSIPWTSSNIVQSFALQAVGFMSGFVYRNRPLALC